MIQRTQILMGAALLTSAVAVVLILQPEASSIEASGMEGHDHAAMMAGLDAAQPVRLTEADARRIGVAFTRVESRVVQPEVRAIGVTTWDERRMSVINPRVSGWVEALHVDFTGAQVEAGAPLLELYSPELVTAQEELALAARLAREATSERARHNAEELLAAARRRFEYWNVAPSEVGHALEMGHIRPTLTLYAPSNGFVVEKHVVEGDRVLPGDVLYRIADLSRVWVEVDVFEHDLGSVTLGQTATVRFEAYPEQTLEARVSYIYPTVSLESRTGRVRVELDNPRGRFRPGMYAEVRLRADPTPPVLTIPQSAVLQTGERTMVFTEDGTGRLIARDVVLGRRVERDVVVLSGLREGDRVVSAAAFLVDAESNLGALTGSNPEPDAMSGAMDHSEHDMGAGGMDHAEHDMGAGAMDHSEHGMEDGTMDHSGHDMGAPAMDHSQHDMGDTIMDHSGHDRPPPLAPAGSATRSPEPAPSGVH